MAVAPRLLVANRGEIVGKLLLQAVAQ